MNKKGMLALKVLIELIVAISGAIILAYAGANLYGLFFPTDSLELPSQNSIDDISYYADLWKNDKSDYVSTVIPFSFEKDKILVGFSKQGPSFHVNGRRIDRPNLAECKDKACLCVFESKSDDTQCIFDFNEEFKGSNKLTECWQLPGIDYVVAPSAIAMKTATLEAEGFSQGSTISKSSGDVTRWSLTPWAFEVNKNEIGDLPFTEKLKSARPFIQFNYGQENLGLPEGYIPPPSGKNYGHLVLFGGNCYAGAFLRDDTFDGSLTTLKNAHAYLEKSKTPAGSFLFLTSASDPHIQGRKEYVQNVQ